MTRNREWSRRKREERRLAGACVNGTTPATHGNRCLRCRLVYRWGVAVAKSKPEYWSGPACNPHKKFGGHSWNDLNENEGAR